MGRSRGRKRGQRKLTLVHEDAAGLDVGATFHVVAVPPERDAEPVRTFQSFTADLHSLAEWLQSIGIRTIAMESTGVYWIPVYEVLEQRGFEVLLVNARDSRNVPGRKTDVNDAQWIQQLHQHGLLRGSFRPRDAIVQLRTYLRHRHVVTDITGLTGMQILRGIVAGNHDPAALAKFRDPRCKASRATITAALTGNYREEHLFALRQSLELYDFYASKIAQCDEQIEVTLTRLNAENKTPAEPLPKVRHRRGPNEPAFDVRSALYTLLGGDLSQVHGFGPYTVLRLLSECGDDMTKWPTAKHFTSWLCLAPGNKITGGRVISSKTRRSANRAATLLRIAAVNVGRTQTALGAFYRRLASRIGKAKAVTATARKLAVIFYNSLRFGIQYLDRGTDYYEQRYRKRVLANLERRARQMGYALMKNPASGSSTRVSPSDASQLQEQKRSGRAPLGAVGPYLRRWQRRVGAGMATVRSRLSLDTAPVTAYRFQSC
jgi:transposase